jgi:hypothetical protein
MLLIDRLLGLECEGHVVQYISDFNSLVGRLNSHKVVLGEDVCVAMLMG